MVIISNVLKGFRWICAPLIPTFTLPAFQIISIWILLTWLLLFDLFLFFLVSLSHIPSDSFIIFPPHSLSLLFSLASFPLSRSQLWISFAELAHSWLTNIQSFRCQRAPPSLLKTFLRFVSNESAKVIKINFTLNKNVYHRLQRYSIMKREAIYPRPRINRPRTCRPASAGNLGLFTAANEDLIDIFLISKQGF